MLNSDQKTSQTTDLPPACAWPTEFRLLVATACLDLTPARQDLIRQLLSSSIDWNSLHWMAIRHGTLALLHQHLIQMPDAHCPEAVLNQQREFCMQNATKNLFHLGELSRIQAACERKGIRLLTYKGPALACEAYGSLALRTFNDVDLLIHANEYKPTRQTLFELGYALSPPYDEAQQHFKLADKGEITFRSPNGGHIDLHTHLLNPAFPFRARFESLWDRRRVLNVAGVPVSTMAAEDLCVYLAVHGTKHCWGLVGWVLDLALLMNSPQLVDWRSVEGRAKSLGASRLLELAVNVAQEVLGVEKPASSISMTGKASLASLAKRIANEMSSEKGVFPSQYLAYQYRCRRSLTGAASLCWSMLFRPHTTDWEFLPLPRWLWGFYLFLRPVRLLAIRLSRLWKTWVHREEGSVR